MKAEEDDMKRLPWGEKLIDLLDTTEFTESLAPGEDVHDLFWPTPIAAHFGMRQEEALQLKTDNFDMIKEFRFSASSRAKERNQKRHQLPHRADPQESDRTRPSEICGGVPPEGPELVGPRD